MMTYPNGQAQAQYSYSLPTMSVVIHAESKAGKSTLACTAPGPLVVFDAEGSTKFLPMRVIFWDPLTQPPPAYDGSWDAVNVVVQTFETLVRGLEWLESGQHHFRSVILDSISEIQRKLKDRIQSSLGGTKWKQDEWGELLARMTGLLRAYRDLTNHPFNPMSMAVFVAETRMDGTIGKMYPNMEGGIRAALPYWFDVIAYLDVLQVQNQDGSMAYDQTGEPYEQRIVYTRKTHPLYYAGQRIQARVPAVLAGQPVSTAPPTMWDATPHLTRDVLWQVFPHLVPQATQ
jgi:hypothetical protein